METRATARQDASPWGLLTSLDLYGCNPETIRDPERIKQYVVGLCDLIGMKRFGECQVVHFGKDERVEGYSMVQFIETSLISGHFSNFSNSAYIDVFSCTIYDPDVLARFTQDYFEADSVNLHSLQRY
ncbi:MAG: S-adenosylmethionine decarboxylase [Deltaproteobacteria bacterium]|nr:S-adenosylmethionine decarboxylase [Deltaproteobacteria bacterium]MBW2137962.1 S-adenosylmethionine decarboxylase [Deltaproteobacteria bacterium]